MFIILTANILNIFLIRVIELLFTSAKRRKFFVDPRVRFPAKIFARFSVIEKNIHYCGGAGELERPRDRFLASHLENIFEARALIFAHFFSFGR